MIELRFTISMDMQDAEWKQKLSQEQFAVLREGATESAFSSDFVYLKDKGLYSCGACGTPLFLSDNKFDSGSGWPSFDQPIHSGVVEFLEDSSHGLHRIEVRCSNCHSHLGHIFRDGPTTTGDRFCINGLALKFEKEN